MIVRTDFDVPLMHGAVVQDARIRASIPTIKYLLSKKALQIIIVSHAGRPHGRRVPSLSLAPIAEHLCELLGKPVAVAKDCISSSIPNQRLVVLENLRFHPGEESNNARFASLIAKHGDLFVNDAVAVMHRKHASMVGIPAYLPSYAGLHVEHEVEALEKWLAKPKHPFLAILGGAKADKMNLLNHMLAKSDAVFVMGVLGNILLKAQGKNAGRVDAQKKDVLEAKRICSHPKLVLPSDAICAKAPGKPHTIRIVPIEDVPAGYRIFDVGPATLTHLFELIDQAKTIFWAGTPGMYEDPHFATGTNLVAKWMARSNAVTVVAGGDTGAAVHRLGLAGKMTHISTGGGAALAFVEGKKLPGLEPLKAR